MNMRVRKIDKWIIAIKDYKPLKQVTEVAESNVVMDKLVAKSSLVPQRPSRLRDT